MMKSKKPKKKKIDKKYRTNVDTISLNCEQFIGSAPFNPYIPMENDEWCGPFTRRVRR